MSWKDYERHPLSEDYEDIDGPIWDRLLENLKAHGNRRGRKIVLHEGKILDGWQLYRACLECNVEPKFQALPKGYTAEEFVEEVNDTRRHETPQRAVKRISERKEREATARANGESVRAIADAEGISEAQVRRDLSGAPPGAPDAMTPVIKGRDGKKYPARATILCARCQRIGTPTAGCQACVEARKVKTTRPPPVAKAKAARKRKGGSELFSWREYDKSLGVVARGPDDLARAYKGEKESAEYEKCIGYLESFTAVWKSWHKRLSK